MSEKKKGLKYESFDITEEEFYLYTKDLPSLHKDDEYELFGNGMSDPLKYKNYKKDGKDAFCIYQTVPGEVTCGRCHIKINTEYHDNCPTCLTTFHTLLEDNRAFNDGCSDKKAEMHERLQAEYNEFLVEHCKKHNQSFDMLTTN
jgi:hypothetical protein